MTPMKSLDSPNLYGYNRSVNNSESSTNSSGNSPDINSVTAENLNLIDLIVSRAAGAFDQDDRAQFVASTVLHLLSLFLAPEFFR